MRKGILEAATDGGCRGNPGLGGWAFVVKLGTEFKGKQGSSQLTTNNEMELKALVELLKWSEQVSTIAKLVVYIDSAYVINGVTKWMLGWQDRGWKTASGTPVKNLELWKELSRLTGRTELELVFEKVKGHSGHPMNEAADARCNISMDELELSNL